MTSTTSSEPMNRTPICSPNAQRYGQRKVMNARHRRCDQLLDIRGRGQIDRRIPDPDTGIDCCCKYHQNTRQLSNTLLIRSHEFF